MQADDAAIAYINKLPAKLHDYALDLWIYLQARGLRPNSNDYGLTFKEALEADYYMVLFGGSDIARLSP